MTESFILPAGKPWQHTLDRLHMHLMNADHSKEWRITVELAKRRSDSQNRYLWSAVYPAIIQGANLEGWRCEEVHDWCLGEHFGWETVEGLGRKRIRPIKRSSKLSKSEFSEYVAFIQQLFAEKYGIVIPDPEHIDHEAQD